MEREVYPSISSSRSSSSSSIGSTSSETSDPSLDLSSLDEPELSGKLETQTQIELEPRPKDEIIVEEETMIDKEMVVTSEEE